MSSLALHIAPIFLLVGLGFILKHRQLFGDKFWSDAERLTFHILFPALLVHSIGRAELGRIMDMLPMVTALVSACLLVAGFCLLLRTVYPKASNFDGPAFCSIFQGVTRPNTYIGLAAAFALYGEAGLAVIAVCIVAIIPLVNILAVLVHQRWAASKEGRAGRSFLQTSKDTAKNPVVAACLIGFALNISGLGLPPVIEPLLNILGKGALPLGLMAVGAGLSFQALSTAPGSLFAVSIVKLLALPVITFAAATSLGVEGIDLILAVLFSALPVSATSYVMSRQMNGDTALMAAIVSITTLLSLFTLPLVVAAIS